MFLTIFAVFSLYLIRRREDPLVPVKRKLLKTAQSFRYAPLHASDSAASPPDRACVDGCKNDRTDYPAARALCRAVCGGGIPVG
jgi:hypothetical protein